MNNDTSDHDNQFSDNRDQELDAMLHSLRTTSPDADMLKRWQSALPKDATAPKQGPLFRRAMEWGIAAAIGFTVATVLSHKNSDMREGAPQNFADVDATEMRFIDN